jgi:hypothetical protein
MNPTNGSWWIVQILSIDAGKRTSENPTNGSGWIVQIFSTRSQGSNSKSHARNLVDSSDLVQVVRKLQKREQSAISCGMR